MATPLINALYRFGYIAHDRVQSQQPCHISFEWRHASCHFRWFFCSTWARRKASAGIWQFLPYYCLTVPRLHSRCWCIISTVKLTIQTWWWFWVLQSINNCSFSSCILATSRFSASSTIQTISPNGRQKNLYVARGSLKAQIVWEDMAFLPCSIRKVTSTPLQYTGAALRHVWIHLQWAVLTI